MTNGCDCNLGWFDRMDSRSSSCRIGWKTKQSRSRALFLGCSGVGADGRLESIRGDTVERSTGRSELFNSSSNEIDRKDLVNATIGGAGIKMEFGILKSTIGMSFSFPRYRGASPFMLVSVHCFVLYCDSKRPTRQRSFAGSWNGRIFTKKNERIRRWMCFNAVTTHASREQWDILENTAIELNFIGFPP